MARRPTRSSSSSRRGGGDSIKVSFKGVEIGKGGAVSAGKYLVEVEEATKEKGDAGPYFKLKLAVVEGPQKGTIFHNISFSESSLWATGAFLQAMGLEIEDDMDIKASDLEGCKLVVEVANEIYEGKKQAKVVDYGPEEEWEEEEEEEERPSRRSSRRGKKEEEEDERPSRRRSSRKEEEEEEEEEEEQTSRRKSSRSSSSRKSKKKVSQEEINEMDEDELNDFVEKNELDVDLSKMKTVTKMRNAVIDAADAAELLED